MAETIRPCRHEDVPALAGMFTRVFRGKQRVRGNELASYIDDIVFSSAGGGAEPRSRVFLDTDGEVRGFIGIWPRRMHINGRSIEAAIAGSLMVDRPEAHPTAGARLLRSFLAGPQDLSFSETANDISQRMWEKAGGERLASSSLDWVRVLRPAGLAVAVAKTAFRPASVLRPVASGIDRLIAGHARNPLTLPAAPGGYHDAEATSVEIAELIPVLSASYAVHPDWRSPTLPFLLAHAETKERYGELQRRIVYGKGRGAVGCYLCYMRRGEVARVLQVLALPDAVGATLDSLFAQAARLGCVAVRGRAESALLDALIARHCLLFHGAAIVMHARDKSLMDEVRNSRVVLTGLAGESWTRFVGGEFA